MKKTKKCHRCHQIKSTADFVNIYGYENSKGKYCKTCFDEREKEFVIELLEGRDFCLYCGKSKNKIYDWNPNGKASKTYVNEDHMEPVSLGGKDTKSNKVYCCVGCNRKKGGKTFTEWLRHLTPKYKKFARSIYIKKHRRTPEEFKPIKRDFLITIRADKSSLIIE